MAAPLSPYLLGEWRDVTLAGSWRHVLADAPHNAEIGLGSGSLLPNIYTAIAGYISEVPDLGEIWPGYFAQLETPAAIMSRGEPHPPATPTRILDGCQQVDIRTPDQPLEFLAVPLVQERTFKHNGSGRTRFASHGQVLGTPIYVAVNATSLPVEPLTTMTDPFSDHPEWRATYWPLGVGSALAPMNLAEHCASR